VVDVVDAAGAARLPGLARWVVETVPRQVRGRVTIALVSDARMRRLNRTYRAADYATDVLSFPAEEARSPSPRHRHEQPAPVGLRPSSSVLADPPFLGDIVIAMGVAARQARERGHALRTELRVLALHGMLHLLGYDHETDAGEMAGIERRLRRRGRLTTGLIERGAAR
jgi:probable rRNA maturation factor